MASTPKISNRTPLIPNNVLELAQQTLKRSYGQRNTPTKDKGLGKGYAADLSNIEKCAKEIGKYSNSDKIVIEKSTLPVKTAEKVKQILNQSNKKMNFLVK